MTDNNGASHVVSHNVTVGNRLPTAAFNMSPANPLSKEAVTFTSTSADPDGTIANYAWDLDGDDAFNDGDGSTLTKTWDTPGPRTVRLRVTDNNGGVVTSAVFNVTVANRLPVASFRVAPATIVEGDEVTLTANSTDEDGTVGTQSWDLDNDGAYDDGTGETATFIAGAPGAYTVGLRAVDNSNGENATSQTIVVGEKPADPTDPLPDPTQPGGEQTFDISSPIVTTPTPGENPTNPVAPLRFLDPFPVVRMRGRTTGRGAKLTLFTVRAPHGSLVELRCTGRGCPTKRVRKTIKTRRQRGSATIHVRQVERFLPAGIELQVSITQKGMVGKYTRVRIRRLSLPVRSDRCLLPDSAKPAACPVVNR